MTSLLVAAPQQPTLASSSHHLQLAIPLPPPDVMTPPPHRSAPADMRPSPSLPALRSPDPDGRRGSLPSHVLPTASETSLAERRRSHVSKYLGTHNHKSEFAMKLREVQERERTVSGDTIKAGLVRGSSLKREVDTASEGSGSGKSNASMSPKIKADPPHVPKATRGPSRSGSLNGLRKSASDTPTAKALPAVEDSCPQQMNTSGPLATHESTNTQTSVEGPLGNGHAASGEDGSSPLFSGSTPGSTAFATFSSPALKTHEPSSEFSDGLSPGVAHTPAFGFDLTVEALSSAPRESLEAQLRDKLSYLSALADENAQLRQLLQRQADLGPAAALRSLLAHANGPGDELNTLADGGSARAGGSEDEGGKEEVIRALSLQLAEQMDAHEKLLFELGLLRSHHATLQALSSDHSDELHVLRHKVAELEDRVALDQVEQAEMEKRLEEETSARRHQEERVATLRQALEDSKLAIKHMQDETKDRRRSVIESRRASAIHGGSMHERRSSQILAGLSTGDAYTTPASRRSSVQGERKASLRALLGEAGAAGGHERKSRRISHLSAEAADEPAASRPGSCAVAPLSDDGGSHRTSAAPTTPAGLGLGFEVPVSHRDPAIPRRRRNSSGTARVHIEGLSPCAEDGSPCMSDEDRARRKQRIDDLNRLEAGTAPVADALSAPSLPARNRTEGKERGGEAAPTGPESEELEKMKVEIAQLKAQLAESEETRLTTQDALRALKQFIAADPAKLPKAPNVPAAPADNDAVPRKTSRWAMPRLPTIVSRASAVAATPSSSSASTLSAAVGAGREDKSPTPSLRSTLSGTEAPTPSASGAASVFAAWTRRTEAHPSAATPAAEPSVPGPAGGGGRFPLAGLVGRGLPPSAASTDASPPSLAHSSASSAASSPVLSPHAAPAAAARAGMEAGAVEALTASLHRVGALAEASDGSLLGTPKAGGAAP